ncbi:MAG: NUDIX domain-containing protein [Candidatus Saccharibacteria bacterium]
MSEPEFFKVSLKVVLRNDKGEKLLLLNPKISSGSFDLPGGRINGDEIGLDVASIIGRELSEEIGDIRYELNPSPIATGIGIGRRTGHPTFYLIFEGRFLSGKIETSAEHDGYRWVRDLPDTDYSNSGIDQAVRNWKSLTAS